MRIIGLTGGISSGKSTVAALFAELGVPIIDSDVIAREVLVTQKDLVDQMVVHFGKRILNAENQLDRKKLGEIVFADISERKWLEQLLHPHIIEVIKQRISQLAKQNISYCVVIIPLLAEVVDAQQLVDRVLVVDASEDLRLKRTQQRDNHSVESIQKIITSQATREQRLKIADDVIHNEQDLPTLKQQVVHLHQKYLAI